MYIENDAVSMEVYVKGSLIWNAGLPREKKNLFVYIKSVHIKEEVKPDWDWLWSGLVELGDTECWLWQGSKRKRLEDVRRVVQDLVGKTRKEISCSTLGCCNPRHKVIA